MRDIDYPQSHLQKIDISFIILSWNSEKYINKCLHSILVDVQQSQYSYEIFIVDNGSQDNTINILKSFHTKYPEHVFPIYLERNTGTTYSRNLALKQTRGEFLCIMDSDTELSAGVIQELTHVLQEDAEIGLVAPKLFYHNGKLQKSIDQFPTILTKLWRFFFLKIIEERENALEIRGSQNEISQQESGLRKVDYAISAMWMMKRDVFEEVGFFDENIFYAPEDVDYCLRVWKAGYSVVYASDVSCIHYTQEISRALLGRTMFSHISGLAYYFWKHKYLFTRPKIRRGT